MNMLLSIRKDQQFLMQNGLVRWENACCHSPCHFAGNIQHLQSSFNSEGNEGIRNAQTLATLRDTLLPRLISGQLRLPEAEATFEENR